MSIGWEEVTNLTSKMDIEKYTQLVLAWAALLPFCHHQESLQV